jgi:biopolymer transport protein ExbB
MEDICWTKRTNTALRLLRNAAALFVIISLFLIVGALDARAWWDNKWDSRKKVVIDTTATGADVKEGLAEYPLLVRLHAGNFAFGHAKNDGADIRFLSGDEKVILKHHIEKFDPVEEIALIWVRVPRILANSNQDFLWMYYGNKNVTGGQDQGGTYDPNHILVYHANEPEGAPRDATAFQNHAVEFTGGHGLAAMIGFGINFNGDSDRIVVKKAPSLNFGSGFTFSAWVRMAKGQDDAYLFAREDEDRALVVGIKGTGLYCRISLGKQSFVTEKAVDLAPGNWHHVSVTVDPTRRVTIYLDGVEATWLKLTGTIPEMQSDLVIGGSLKDRHFFAGDMDDIAVSNVPRSAGWARALFKGQGPQGVMALALEEEVNTGGENLTLFYLKVVAQTISLDGWVVIAILVVLGAMTVIVFFNKMLLIRATARENRDFAGEFGKQIDPRALEGRDDDYEASSMYRVYRAASQELKLWVGNPDGRKLTQKGLNAVQAALEKQSMGESRKMAAGLQILTSAISGGPFLGLLGTVWGVMNTFAGMAAAGEANLTAIAPGVASALACTLMGLVVAIPALFAYAYLTARIKDITADINMFMSEYVLKLEGGMEE